jgi:hypothetical protein
MDDGCHYASCFIPWSYVEDTGKIRAAAVSMEFTNGKTCHAFVVDVVELKMWNMRIRNAGTLHVEMAQRSHQRSSHSNSTTVRTMALGFSQSIATKKHSSLFDKPNLMELCILIQFFNLQLSFSYSQVRDTSPQISCLISMVLMAGNESQNRQHPSGLLHTSLFKITGVRVKILTKGFFDFTNHTFLL